MFSPLRIYKFIRYMELSHYIKFFLSICIVCLINLLISAKKDFGERVKIHILSSAI